MQQFRLRCLIAAQKKTFDATSRREEDEDAEGNNIIHQHHLHQHNKNTSWQDALEFFMIPKDTKQLVHDHFAPAREVETATSTDPNQAQRNFSSASTLIEKPICILPAALANDMLGRVTGAINQHVSDCYLTNNKKKKPHQMTPSLKEEKPEEITKFQDYFVESVTKENFSRSFQLLDVLVDEVETMKQQQQQENTVVSPITEMIERHLLQQCFHMSKNVIPTTVATYVRTLCSSDPASIHKNFSAPPQAKWLEALQVLKQLQSKEQEYEKQQQEPPGIISNTLLGDVFLNNQQQQNANSNTKNNILRYAYNHAASAATIGVIRGLSQRIGTLKAIEFAATHSHALAVADLSKYGDNIVRALTSSYQHFSKKKKENNNKNVSSSMEEFYQVLENALRVIKLYDDANIQHHRRHLQQKQVESFLDDCGPASSGCSLISLLLQKEDFVDLLWKSQVEKIDSAFTSTEHIPKQSSSSTSSMSAYGSHDKARSSMYDNTEEKLLLTEQAVISQKVADHFYQLGYNVDVSLVSEKIWWQEAERSRRRSEDRFPSSSSSSSGGDDETTAGKRQKALKSALITFFNQSSPTPRALALERKYFHTDLPLFQLLQVPVDSSPFLPENPFRKRLLRNLPLSKLVQEGFFYDATNIIREKYVKLTYYQDSKYLFQYQKDLELVLEGIHQYLMDTGCLRELMMLSTTTTTKKNENENSKADEETEKNTTTTVTSHQNNSINNNSTTLINNRIPFRIGSIFLPVTKGDAIDAKLLKSSADGDDSSNNSNSNHWSFHERQLCEFICSYADNNALWRGYTRHIERNYTLMKEYLSIIRVRGGNVYKEYNLVRDDAKKEEQWRAQQSGKTLAFVEIKLEGYVKEFLFGEGRGGKTTTTSMTSSKQQEQPEQEETTEHHQNQQEQEEIFIEHEEKASSSTTSIPLSQQINTKRNLNILPLPQGTFNLPILYRDRDVAVVLKPAHYSTLPSVDMTDKKCMISQCFASKLWRTSPLAKNLQKLAAAAAAGAHDDETAETSSSSKNSSTMLRHALIPPKCGVTNRLDKGTSGYITFSFSQDAMSTARGGQRSISEVGVQYSTAISLIVKSTKPDDREVVSENIGADGILLSNKNDTPPPTSLTKQQKQKLLCDQVDKIMNNNPPLMASRPGRLWKQYYALVIRTVQLPAEMGVISSPIRGQSAITRYKVLKNYRDGFTLMRCSICTGRRHQIREHLSSIGCPIVNDVVIGGPVATTNLLEGNQLALHLFESSFMRPSDGERVSVTVPLPMDFVEMLKKLEESGDNEESFAEY